MEEIDISEELNYNSYANSYNNSIDITSEESYLENLNKYLDKINLDKFSSLVNEHSKMLYKKDLRNNEFEVPKRGFKIKDADIMIAAITSCTNTANPKNVIAAGLIAKKLVELGIKRNEKVIESYLGRGSKIKDNW